MFAEGRELERSDVVPSRRRRVGGRLCADSHNIDSVLPANEHDSMYDELPSVAAAVQECKTLQEGNEVSAFDDEELGVQVVELLGHKAAIRLPCSSILRYLCLHVKILHGYFSFEVEIVDDRKRYRYIDVRNARSAASIGEDRASLPLQVQPGWQHLNVDLEKLVRIAFGSTYLTTTQVMLRASARVSKVFFQAEPYSDFELPAHLRAVAG